MDVASCFDKGETTANARVNTEAAMKAALFETTSYMGPSEPGWPAPVTSYSSEDASLRIDYCVVETHRLTDLVATLVVADEPL